MDFAIRELVPSHVETVKAQRLPLLAKVEIEVRSRLQKRLTTGTAGQRI